MAFVSTKSWGDNPAIGLTSKRPGLRWAAVPAFGAVLVLWSVATMAGLYSVGTSLTAASNGLPQSLLTPRTIALSDARLGIPPRRQQAGDIRSHFLVDQCDAGCMRSASSFAHERKQARLKQTAKRVAPNAIASMTSLDARFDGVVAKAALSHEKLAAAFARASGPAARFTVANAPAEARFARAEPVACPISTARPRCASGRRSRKSNGPRGWRWHWRTHCRTRLSQFLCRMHLQRLRRRPPGAAG